jgi:hypothetical protein
MKTRIAKTILAALILSVLFYLSGLIQGAVSGWDVILCGFIANLMIASLLICYVSVSVLKGLRLALALFLLYFLIGFFNILIEAYIFNVTDRSITLNKMYTGFAVTLIYAPIIVFLFDKWEGSSKQIDFIRRPVLSWVWRIIVSDLLYLFFYLLAGFILYLAYPPLMDFYEGKIPPFELMVSTHFYRAVVFIFVALLVLRTTDIPILKKAFYIGIFFAIIGGIAPLIPPNEHMPGYIRLGHAFEVLVSNFSYGFVISYLLGQKNG